MPRFLKLPMGPPVPEPFSSDYTRSIDLSGSGLSDNDGLWYHGLGNFDSYDNRRLAPHGGHRSFRYFPDVNELVTHWTESNVPIAEATARDVLFLVVEDRGQYADTSYKDLLFNDPNSYFHLQVPAGNPVPNAYIRANPEHLVVAIGSHHDLPVNLPTDAGYAYDSLVVTEGGQSRRLFMAWKYVPLGASAPSDITVTLSNPDSTAWYMVLERVGNLQLRIVGPRYQVVPANTVTQHKIEGAGLPLGRYGPAPAPYNPLIPAHDPITLWSGGSLLLNAIGGNQGPPEVTYTTVVDGNLVPGVVTPGPAPGVSAYYDGSYFRDLGTPLFYLLADSDEFSFTVQRTHYSPDTRYGGGLTSSVSGAIRGELTNYVILGPPNRLRIGDILTVTGGEVLTSAAEEVPNGAPYMPAQNLTGSPGGSNVFFRRPEAS